MQTDALSRALRALSRARRGLSGGACWHYGQEAALWIHTRTAGVWAQRPQPAQRRGEAWSVRQWRVMGRGGNP